MHVRDATDDDAPALVDLFNALIASTTVAWRDHEADETELRAGLADHRAAGQPWLVAEHDGEVVGYACWSDFRSTARFPGYRHTVEHTIHVRGDRHGQGVGRLLLGALIAEAERRDVHVMVAAIDADNLGSIAFHQRLGFDEVGRMHQVGRKFDRWLDLVLMQRTLTP